jgi:hypothetical protein
MLHWLECVGGGRVAQMHTVWRRSDCEKATPKTTTDGLPFIYNEEGKVSTSLKRTEATSSCLRRAGRPLPPNILFSPKLPPMVDRTPVYKRAGDVAFDKSDKVSQELFVLTYGAVVQQLVTDFEDETKVNEELKKLGQNIGARLVDELFAKTGPSLGSRCTSFRDTAEVVAYTGIKMFLGLHVDVVGWNTEGTACSLLFSQGNPLTNFVELPPDKNEIKYCNVLCGVIQGALSMVKMNVKCEIVRDTLRGSDVDEIRLELLSYIDVAMDASFDEDE